MTVQPCALVAELTPEQFDALARWIRAESFAAANPCAAGRVMSDKARTEARQQLVTGKE